MFKNVRLSAKLVGGFILVALLTLLVGGIGIWGGTKLKHHLHDVGSVRLPSIQALLVIRQAQTAVGSVENSLLAADLDEKNRQDAFTRAENAKTRADEAWKIYEPLPQTAEEAAQWQKFVPAWQTWWADHNEFVKLANEFFAIGIGNPPVLQRDLNLFVADHYKLVQKLNDLIDRGQTFEGGVDPTACNFGKWLPTFKTQNAEINRLMNEIKPYHNEIHAAVHKIRELAEKGDKENAKKVLFNDLSPNLVQAFDRFTPMQKEADRAMELYSRMMHQALVTNTASYDAAKVLLDKIVAINEEVAAQAQDQSAKDSRLAMLSSTIGMAVGFSLALFIGITLSLAITKPLNRIIASLNEGAEQVTSAASQVSAASQSLAEGATEQAAGLEETSSSLEEMASMTKKNAENAAQANNLASEARTAADSGSASMTRMTSAISEIQKSSQETAKIIKVIDEIAFQTNLHALNTAVSQMDKVTQQNAANAEESASASEELSAQAQQMNAIVSDLAALVGGANNTRSKSQNQSPQKKGSAKSNALGHTDHTFHQIAQAKSKIQKQTEKPASKIPLTEKEFEEFSA